MLSQIYSCTAPPPPPPNLSYMVPRDTGYMPIHQSEVLTVLYLQVHLLFPVGIELQCL